MKSPDASLDALERRLGQLLQAGVVTAAICLTVGLVAWIIAGNNAVSSAALTIGLLTLMATPILRVVVSLAAYVRMRDWFFVLTTVAVFVLLAITVTLAWLKMKAAG